MPEFGALRIVDPREMWPSESADFTPWLAQNIAILAEAIGLELEVRERESPVGDFSLDLLAYDVDRDREVVIENQLTATNHDHLGKLLTYAAGRDAGVIVWIAPEFRDEHRQALDWLNSRTEEDTEFFGVVLEALQIDESRPAPNFRLVAAPNEWRKANVGVRPAAASESSEAYRVFFQGLLDDLREQHRFTGGRIAQPKSWYSFTSDAKGVRYSATFKRGNRVSTELYLDTGETESTKRLFDRVIELKTEVEADFGEPLSWERLDNRRACRIAAYREGSIEDDAELLEEIKQWAIDRLLRFKRVLIPRLLALEGNNRPPSA